MSYWMAIESQDTSAGMKVSLGSIHVIRRLANE